LRFDTAWTDRAGPDRRKNPSICKSEKVQFGLEGLVSGVIPHLKRTTPASPASGIVRRPRERCRALSRQKRFSEALNPVSHVPNLAQVMSLKNKADLLMHGVVLQIRVFRPRAPMFHVKHLCVKGLPSQAGGAMFHVKPFSPALLRQPSARRCFT